MLQEKLQENLDKKKENKYRDLLINYKDNKKNLKYKKMLLEKERLEKIKVKRQQKYAARLLLKTQQANNNNNNNVASTIVNSTASIKQ